MFLITGQEMEARLNLVTLNVASAQPAAVTEMKC